MGNTARIAECHPDKPHLAKGLCRACYHREWRRADPRYGRRNHLLSTFKLTLHDYERLLEECDGLCAICGEPNPNGRRLSIDHCHETEEIRGLLCGRCNSGLGFFRDRPELLEKAITYLARS